MSAAHRSPGSTTEYLNSSTKLDDAVEDPSDGWWGVFSAGKLRNITLWATSLFCAGLAWLGACLFLYVLLSRYFLPETAHYSRSLYFDYTKADAVATAHFLPDTQYNQARSSEAAAAQARFLPPKQRVDVWLELATPEAHGQAGDELFQVFGELMSADGRVAGASSRPCLVRQRYWLTRTLRLWLNAPFVMLGLWDERQEVRVPLFSNYREQATTPFVVFRATLQARAGGGRLPQLYEATVHLQLRLGFLSRLLSLTRPGGWIAWSLIALSLTSIVGGCVGCISLLGLWIVTKGTSSAARSPAGNSESTPHPDSDEDMSDDDESPSAPQMPPDMQGASVDPSGTSSQYKDNHSKKMSGFPSQSSLFSDDSPPSGLGSQEPHVEFSRRPHAQKKVM